MQSQDTSNLIKYRNIMRRIFFILCLIIICISAKAQYSSVNSFIRKEIVSYTKDQKGFYVKETDRMVDIVTDITENYAYDKLCPHR